MYRLTLLLFLCFALNQVRAQDFENYKSLESIGDMPEDFKLFASEKYKREVEESVKEDDSRKDRRDIRNFALESNFAITDLLHSGRVIYGDALGTYINKIADEILKSDPKLRKELRFYIIKSTVANAFSTNQGLIFITSGLIAQVENEAQLAFVIAHEIVHYTEKHNYEHFKKREAILKRAGRSSSMTVEEKLRSLYKYSKGNETEADIKGLELFLKSKYNPYSAISSMDVLLYSYLPFDMLEWKSSIFETEYYKFPEKYTSTKLDEISANEDDDDEKRTHPNMAKRKAAIMELISDKEIDTVGKEWYVISKSEFQMVRKIARYELASLYLKSGNPLKAYYIAYLLDKTYGATTYTDKIKALCIYSMARHSSYSDNLRDYGCDKSDYEGEVQQVAYFFSKMRSKELSVMASKYIWEMSAKYPEDAQIKRMRDQTFYDMFEINHVSTSLFKEFEPPSDDTAAVEVKKGTKVERLKSKQKKRNRKEKYYYAAFYELFKDKEFSNFYNTFTQNLADKESNDEDEDEDDDTEYKKELVESRGFKKRKKAKEFEPINSLVLFNPDYTGIIKNKTYLLRDEIRQNELSQYYKDEAKIAGLDLQILDKTGDENYDTKAFNNRAQLKDWLIERLNNDTLTMELYQKPYIEEAMTEYGSKHLAWTTYKFTVSRRPFNFTALVTCMFLYPVLPYYFVWQFSKDKYLENLILVFDVETGKPVMVDYTAVEKRPSKMNLKATIYNQFYTLKHGK